MPQSTPMPSSSPAVDGVAATGVDNDPALTSRRNRGLSLGARLALLLAALLIVSAASAAIYSAVSVRRAEGRSADQSMINVHQATRLLIDQAQDEVATYRANALFTRKQQLKDLTMAEVAAMDNLRAAVGRGEMSDATAKAIASQMLFDFRYGNDNYFFAFTPEMTSIEEPNPQFRGNVLDYRDPTGKYIFRAFQNVALGKGQGYVGYVANRAGENVPSAKTSFIYYYRPWQWVIGTGVYIDDITAEADARLAAVKRSLGTSLAAVKFNTSGFFFVLDQHGALVLAPANRSMVPFTSSAAGRRLASVIAARAPKADGPITQFSAEARMDGTALKRWRFDVSTVKSSHWVLVSAVPQSEIDRTANRITLFQVLIDALVLLVGLFVGLLSSRRIVRPVETITQAATALEEDRFDPTVLDAAANRRDELGALARAFRRMGSEVVDRQRRLREQVKDLTVVVDRKKVERDVGEITESDYFQELAKRAEDLRKRP